MNLADWKPCSPGCQGYDAFVVDRDPGMELERCDDCARFVDDDTAAVQFVRDLEKGLPFAVKRARMLLDTEHIITIPAEEGEASE